MTAVIAPSRGMVEELAFVEVRLDPSDGIIKTIDSLRITPTFGAFGYTDLDLGAPSTRDSVQDLPDADGTYDDTMYHGSRSISLSLQLIDGAFDGLDISSWNPRVGWNSAAYWTQVLGAWMRPGRRFRLYFKLKGQSRRFMDVRPSQVASPLSFEHPSSREMQLTLVCPSGRINSFSDAQSPDWRNYRRIPFVMPGTGESGIAWTSEINWSTGITWQADISSPADVFYDGTVAAGAVFRLQAGANAPLVNPRLKVTGPDGVVRTKGFTFSVPAGSWVTIDSEQRLTYLNHDVTSRMDRYLADPLTGTQEAWPVLSPGYNPLGVDPRYGYNKVEMSALTAGAGAFYEVLWWDQYIA